MVNKKISRKEAVACGQKVYWREKPCPQGHSGWFRIGGPCVECQKINSNRYKSANKEVLSEKRKTYLKSDGAKQVMENYMNNGGRKKAAERQCKRRRNDPVYAQKQREISKKWKELNSEKINQTRKKYYEKNKEKITEQRRKYHDENREKIRESRRQYYREYMSNRRKNDPNFKLLTRMRDFNRRCVEAIKGVKNWRTKDVLGYTPEQLRLHIESIWLTGMTWENYGEWHIDHIKSIKSHVDEGTTDIKIINALTNLQPLWAFDNLSKGA